MKMHKKKAFVVAIALLVTGGMVLSATLGFIDFMQWRNVVSSSPDELVATVNGEGITRKEYNFYFNQVAAIYEAQGINLWSPDEADLRRELERQALDRVIGDTLLLQQAREEGIAPGEEEVHREYERTMEHFDSQREMERRLREIGFTPEEFQGYLKKQMVQGNYQEYFQEKEDLVTEEEVLALYEQRQEMEEDLPGYEEMRTQLEEELRRQKAWQAVDGLAQELREQGEILIP